ncbi:MAG: amino acid adenylation domain-containing protein, partial [Lachnospiraceae bacterium]|nr:amino acid adenylation domain-containing protein [Lachnospiraceae bacterium]
MSKNVQKGFWISQFENALPELDMPRDFAASNGRKSNKDEEISAMGFVWKGFDDGFSEIIGRKTTGPEDRFTLFLAAEMIMLGKYSNQEDVIIGTAAGKNGSGAVLNLLALRGKPEKRKTFDEFLSEVREYCRKAFENRDYPYGELIRELTEHNYLKRDFLFQVMLLPEESDSRADEDAIKAAGAIPELLFALQKDGLCLHYRKSLYGEASATRILEHLECIVRQGVQDGGILIDNMEMLAAGEYERIVKGFNGREKRAYKETLIEMFERQVKNDPERPAVVCGGRTLTYDEFNKKINNVAHRLRKMGIKQNDVVALLTHRSFEMLIGIFAVMKSGAAFLPIDPMYPEERIRFVLADSAPKVLLKYMVQIDTDVPSVDLSDEEVWKEPAENPEHVKCMDDLFYILYTSGTTGNPKGAMITEEAAVNAALGTCGAEGNMFDRTLLATNYAFVLSLYEYMTFIRGGCGFLIGNEDKQDTKKCAAFIKENWINTMVSTASYFDTLATQYKEVLIGNLEHVFLGGEKFKVPGALLGDESAGDMIMYNLYGQTETCEIAIYRKKVRELKNEKRQYIGFPVGNIEAYIMNGDKLCGIGVPGELCVVHEGAAGYLNLPQLNEETYVKNPFGEGKMYRTGDRAKWCENGVIEILGRMDDLVKIRGFRIELGEIENRIRQLDRIQNCAVTARPDAGGDMAIHAYLVGEGKLNMAAVKKELSKTLPVYMIPPYMMQLPEIPMTKNGKLDYRALPEIRNQKKGKYIAPGNEREKQICECYEEILGAEKVGIRDNFFE